VRRVLDSLLPAEDSPRAAERLYVLYHVAAYCGLRRSVVVLGLVAVFVPSIVYAITTDRRSKRDARAS
jgi:hypothetical protein